MNTWKISSKGMREDVVKSIDSAADIPTEWKAALKAALPNSKAVSIDAHFHPGEKAGKSICVLHLTASTVF